MIQAESLTKDYGPNRAVDSLSFDVAQGEIVGFLGPNGAGKSTTIRMVTGFSPPTSGTARINGVDVLKESHKARNQIGYLPESTPLYPEMRVTEYLDYRGRLMKMKRNKRRERINAVIDQCNLEPMRRRTIGRLSKGNKQRVGLAQALLHEPPVLILDEPTSGFDPNQIQQFRKLLNQLKGKHTILLCTHILPEIQQTADRILILSHGKLVADGTADELHKKAAQSGLLIIETQATPEQLSTTLAGWSTQSIETNQDGWSRATLQPTNNQSPEQLAALLQKAGHPIRELKRQTPGLESLFASMTGNASTSNNTTGGAE